VGEGREYRNEGGAEHSTWKKKRIVRESYGKSGVRIAVYGGECNIVGKLRGAVLLGITVGGEKGNQKKGGGEDARAIVRHVFGGLTEN